MFEKPCLGFPSPCSDGGKQAGRVICIHEYLIYLLVSTIEEAPAGYGIQHSAKNAVWAYPFEAPVNLSLLHFLLCLSLKMLPNSIPIFPK